MSRNILAFLVALLLLGTAPSAALAQGGPASCTTTGKTLYVRDVMSDLYLWYAEMPDVDPVSFASPQDSAAGLRTARLQRRGPRILGWQSVVNAY